MSQAPVTLRSAALAFGAFSLVVGSVMTLAHFRGVARAQASLGEEDPAAMKVVPMKPPVPTPVAPPFAGLDLSRVVISETEATTVLPGRRVAHLTLDARLQRAAVAALKQHKLPEGVIVMMDPDTGAILAYASRSSDGQTRDMAIEAFAPSASVFKLVTASALAEKGAGPQTRECFARSAEQRVLASDLVVDPLRDKWCMTLATALGKSENAVFARMAHEKLDKPSLDAAAHALGWGEAVAFDVPVQPSKLEIPDDSLGFARTAAGFWNTTLSPLHAAVLSATIARGGEAVRPRIVQRVTSDTGHVDYEASREPETHRTISEAAAESLTTMMEHTVAEGTSYRAFHDAHRTAFVPVTVAGKTGTLGDPEHLYTWFTGFAPSHARPGERRVAIAVLVVNKPRWHVKANVVAREMLREFFHEEPRVAVNHIK